MVVVQAFYWPWQWQHIIRIFCWLKFGLMGTYQPIQQIFLLGRQISSWPTLPCFFATASIGGAEPGTQNALHVFGNLPLGVAQLFGLDRRQGSRRADGNG